MRSIYSANDYIDWEIVQRQNFIVINIFNASDHPLQNVHIHPSHTPHFHPIDCYSEKMNLGAHEECIWIIPFTVDRHFNFSKSVDIFIRFEDDQGDVCFSDRTIVLTRSSHNRHLSMCAEMVFSDYSDWPVFELNESHFTLPTLPDTPSEYAPLMKFLTRYPNAFMVDGEVKGSVIYANFQPLFLILYIASTDPHIKVYYDARSCPSNFMVQVEKDILSRSQDIFGLNRNISFELGRLTVKIEDVLSLAREDPRIIDNELTEYFTRLLSDAHSLASTLDLPHAVSIIRHLLAKVGTLFIHDSHRIKTLSTKIQALHAAIAGEIIPK